MANATTKVVTGLVRLSYVQIFNKKSFTEGTDAKYSLCVLVPKKDTKTLKKIQAAVKAAAEEGISTKFNGKKPSNMHLPLRDGDEERAAEAPEYKDMFFFNCKSDRKPGIVDKDRNEILDPDEVYSGCWGRVSVNFYPYSVKGNNGVAVGLNNVQKLKDDQRLGGAAASAEDDFNDDFEFSEDDDFSIDSPF
jgi:hypothetical protein|nr:MAG TPA_asm: DNA helix destabilizing protein [Caudoviricetes sp.]